MRSWFIYSRYFLAMICCIVTISNADAQKVLNLLSKGKILIGEQIIFTVKVQGITKGGIRDDFHFPDTVNHIEFLSDSAQEISGDYVHTLTLTCFDSGTFQIPSFRMQLDDGRILTTNTLNITVLPVDVSGLQDYHDIKDILEVPLENDWWVVASLVITAVLSLFIVLWVMSPAPATPTVAIPVAGLTDAYRKLTEALKALQQVDTATVDGKKHLTTESLRLVRAFIDLATGNDTAHLTTGEYMIFYKSKLPDVQTESRFYQWQRFADAVKFAQYEPPADELAQVLPDMQHTADAVYHQMKSAT